MRRRHLDRYWRQMGRPPGGGKWLVEGCKHIDALDWRRDGYLQPPTPGKGRDRVLTRDLTKEYVTINGDYRS